MTNYSWEILVIGANGTQVLGFETRVDMFLHLSEVMAIEPLNRSVGQGEYWGDVIQWRPTTWEVVRVFTEELATVPPMVLPQRMTYPMVHDIALAVAADRQRNRIPGREFYAIRRWDGR